jgi:hypothetical protein
MVFSSCVLALLEAYGVIMNERNCVMYYALLEAYGVIMNERNCVMYYALLEAYGVIMNERNCVMYYALLEAYGVIRNERNCVMYYALLEAYGVIMNERNCVTYYVPVGLTVLMVGLRDSEVNLSIKFIFPRNMLESSVFRGSVVWEPLLLLNRDRLRFHCITLTFLH